MKITLFGSDRFSAVEQAAMNFFPNTPESEAVVTVKKGKIWTTATVEIVHDNRTEKASCRIKSETYTVDSALSGSLPSRRNGNMMDFLLKQTFFKTTLPFFSTPPAWGSLTGIRPAKLTAMLMENGEKPDKVLKEKYHVQPSRRKLAIECAKETLKAKNSLKPNEIALYVGIPFCPSRCDYCSFVSLDVEKSNHLIQPYLERLIDEVNLMGDFVRSLNLTIVTIYVGGGTPTTLTAPQLELLCKALIVNFESDALREFTVEAGRPDTITFDKLKALKSNGVTRISINPQSTQPDILQGIGRKHSVQDIEEAYKIAHILNFNSINADIIAGLPNDTPESFEKTVDDVLRWKPDNITVHTLSLKKGAKLFTEQNPYGIGIEQMLEIVGRKLTQHSYKPYYLYRQKYMAGGFENVGWCLPETENLYNICMMEEITTVLAVGAGGVSKLINHKTNCIERVSHCKYPLEYLQDTGRAVRNLLNIKAFFGRNEE